MSNEHSTEEARPDPIPRCEHGAPIWACSDATKRVIERIAESPIRPAAPSEEVDRG